MGTGSRKNGGAPAWRLAQSLASGRADQESLI